MERNILEIRNLNKKYSSKDSTTIAVDNVSFKIPEGKFVSIIGESGSGKTTLGRMIMGLVESDSGEILFRNKLINLPKYKKTDLKNIYNHIQMIFQNPSISLNSQKNVYTILKESFKAVKYHKLILNSQSKLSNETDNQTFKEWIDDFLNINDLLSAGNLEEIINSIEIINNKMRSIIMEKVSIDNNYIFKNELRKAIRLKKNEIKNYKKEISKLKKNDDISIWINKINQNKLLIESFKKYDYEFDIWNYVEEFENNNITKPKKNSAPKAVNKIIKFREVDYDIYKLFKDLIQFKGSENYESLKQSVNVFKSLIWIFGGNIHWNRRRCIKTIIDDNVYITMQRVGLDPKLAFKYPINFSGGMQQRVSIGRAIIASQELIIADEPIASLDISMQATILNLLKDIQKKYKKTIILIAHDLSIVEHISDYVIVFKDGKIVEQGKTKSVFDNPKNEYTKQLIKLTPKIVKTIK